MFLRHKIKNNDPANEVKITINGETCGHLAVESITIKTAKNYKKILNEYILKEIEKCD